MKIADSNDKSVREDRINKLDELSMDAWLREKVLPVAKAVKDDPSILLSTQEVRSLRELHRKSRMLHRFDF